MSVHRSTMRGAVVLTAVICLSQEAPAQLPGLPVLQNAFANAGLAFGANFGGGANQSVYGLAASWGMRRGQRTDAGFALSAGAAAQRTNEATRGAYGARAAMRLWSSAAGSLGVGAFAGVGGAPRTRSTTTTANPAVMNVPIGASVGYRRPMGERRGISAYVSPFFQWTRTETDAVVSRSALRFAAGLDFAFTRALGITVGGDFGSRSRDTGDQTGTFGAAISFVPGNRR